jgi:MFS family permease
MKNVIAVTFRRRGPPLCTMRAMRMVWMLSATQALCMSGSFLFVLLGGIIGTHLAPTPALATLPVSLLVAGVAASVVPAGLLIRRFGRRPVFVGSALQAAAGCVLAGYAVATGRYALFCAAAFLLGANNAVVMQYRFAATEYVEAARASRAIAVVLSGALVAAWLGPELAVRTADLVPAAHYAGSFYAGTGLYVLAALLLARLKGAAPAGALDSEPTRPLREIAAQPVFQVAVLAALTSYAVMSFIMTATPISMHVVDGHDEVATARVIQVHLLAMYLPSLASGWIIGRFGDRPVIVAGTLLMIACVAIAFFAGHAVFHYGLALGVLGLGWNLLFIAATTLLTKTYRRGERIQAQTLNDFLVFGAQAVASLMAGVAVTTIGWEGLNLATLPLLAAVLLATLALGRRPVAAPAR